MVHRSNPNAKLQIKFIVDFIGRVPKQKQSAMSSASRILAKAAAAIARIHAAFLRLFTFDFVVWPCSCFRLSSKNRDGLYQKTKSHKHNQ